MEGLRGGGVARERVCASPGRKLKSGVSSKPPQKSALCSCCHLGLFEHKAWLARRGRRRRRCEEGGRSRQAIPQHGAAPSGRGWTGSCFSWRRSAPDPVRPTFSVRLGEKLRFAFFIELMDFSVPDAMQMQGWREASLLRFSQPG